jgi:hypothetical protein
VHRRRHTGPVVRGVLPPLGGHPNINVASRWLRRLAIDERSDLILTDSGGAGGRTAWANRYSRVTTPNVRSPLAISPGALARAVIVRSGPCSRLGCVPEHGGFTNPYGDGCAASRVRGPRPLLFGGRRSRSPRGPAPRRCRYRLTGPHQASARQARCQVSAWVGPGCRVVLNSGHASAGFSRCRTPSAARCIDAALRRTRSTPTTAVCRCRAGRRLRTGAGSAGRTQPASSASGRAEWLSSTSWDVRLRSTYP